LPPYPLGLLQPDFAPKRSPIPEEFGALLLRLAPEWDKVQQFLQQLQQKPDLTYLCSRAPSDMPASSSSSLTGLPFWFGGRLVVLSFACEPGAQELSVGRALRDALRWEGDPDTLMVLGTLDDLAAHSDAFESVAACAARRHKAQDRQGKPLDVDLGRWNYGAASDEEVGAPFCRSEGLVGICIGSFEAAFGGRGGA